MATKSPNIQSSFFNPFTITILPSSKFLLFNNLLFSILSLNINTGGISQCCMGYINSAGGYKFKYK